MTKYKVIYKGKTVSRVEIKKSEKEVYLKALKKGLPTAELVKEEKTNENV